MASWGEKENLFPYPSLFLREELLDGKLIDNMETTENNLEGNGIKTSRGLVFKIASKSKWLLPWAVL